ncbi:hypothetical protein PMAYCL1PPCAC_02145 [Pristionchus mayeri]|uniref:Uncharacterized protein n=1 Tax=Pristionchus mayeri TaxID=1317129 RepID=A0AAN4Z7K9_9BILA|nr:hypothetical protein PMAYCL1PPCAC_02145 [Pristionchus mayeri]
MPNVNVNAAVSFTSQLYNQIFSRSILAQSTVPSPGLAWMTISCSPLHAPPFSDDNVEVAKSIVARLYYAEEAREKRRREEQAAAPTAGHDHATPGTSHQPTSSMRDEVLTECLPSTFDAISLASSSGVSSASSSSSTSSSSSSREQPLYDVFLGGSCGNTVWRRQLVIPFLKKRAITYYDPQRSVWSENMIYEESIAKENSSLFLFVLDPATVNATSFLEIAYFAARKAPKLLVVFLGKTEWREKAHPEDVPDRLRTCMLLDRILAAHHVPMLHSIEDALVYIEDDIIGGKSWLAALSHPRHRLPFLSLRTRRALNCASLSLARLRRSTTLLRAAAASTADVAIVMALHLTLPHLPLVWIVVPIVALNVLLFGSAAAYSAFKARYTRRLGELHCGTGSGRSRQSTASVALPRMAASAAAVTQPLLPQAPPLRTSAVARAKALRAASESGTPSTLPLPFGEQVRRRAGGGGGKGRKGHTPEMCHDVYLASSSDDETQWVGLEAAPFLARHAISYSTVLASGDYPTSCRMNLLMKGSKHFKQLLYYIPSTKTFLSGMLEIAYLLGHANWQVTICVPREAEQLEADREDENDEERAARRRRNDCYAIAFCYLKDMAKRKQSRVFSNLDDALVHVLKQTRDQ